jgi:hypothetical protein
MMRGGAVLNRLSARKSRDEAEWGCGEFPKTALNPARSRWHRDRDFWMSEAAPDPASSQRRGAA